MSDLVERLRFVQRDMMGAVSIVAEEAADEIERLRAKNNRLTLLNSTLEMDVERLRADLAHERNCVADTSHEFAAMHEDITRLRAANLDWNRRHQLVVDEWRAEVERLRDIEERLRYTEPPSPRWIPVSERLPERMVNVLTDSRGHSHPVVQFRGPDKDGRVWWSEDGTLPYVTHWMPLPEAPDAVV